MEHCKGSRVNNWRIINVSLRIFFFCCCFFFFLCVYASYSSNDDNPENPSEIRSKLTLKTENNYFLGQHWESMAGARRLLREPGSWPPDCTSKCGRCKPCKPVHVPVPPGTSVTQEYYPEAWRCKCGNKLYMP